MTGILGVAAMLTVLALSLIITRIATVALVKTGLSREAARFQARSAFTGTGFTTREAESVVDHPVRRRIIMVLMIVRSAGLVTIIISLILSFADTVSQKDRLWRLAFLTAGVLALWVAAGSRLIDRFVSDAISRALSRWTDLDVRDYASLLKLSSNYSVTELRVERHDWLEGKELRECNLDDEGVRVPASTGRTDGTVALRRAPRRSVPATPWCSTDTPRRCTSSTSGLPTSPGSRLTSGRCPSNEHVTRKRRATGTMRSRRTGRRDRRTGIAPRPPDPLNLLRNKQRTSEAPVTSGAP